MKAPFENRLAAQPMRDIPVRWRAQILANAKEQKPSKLTALIPVIRTWLWPHPLAWAAIAAGWLVAAGLMLSGPHEEELAVTPKQYRDLPGPSPVEYYVELRLCREFANISPDEPPVVSIEFIAPPLDVPIRHD